MRKLMLVTAALFIASPALADDQPTADDLCRVIAQFAEGASRQHQNGMSLSRALEIVDQSGTNDPSGEFRSIARALMIDIWDGPRFPGLPELQEQMIAKHRDDAHVTCLRRFGA